MTRTQRLELLKQIEEDIHVPSIESTFLEDAKSCAIHSVIEELEQEPCEDAISRAEAIKEIQDRRLFTHVTKDGWFWLANEQVVLNVLNGLPPVTPKQKMGRWIPVSERLPDIHNYTKHYLVTLKRGGVFVAMFTETDGNSWWTYDDVIAWMPLPGPYKESEDKE